MSSHISDGLRIELHGAQTGNTTDVTHLLKPLERVDLFNLARSITPFANIYAAAVIFPNAIRYWAAQAELVNDLCTLMNCTQKEAVKRLRESVYSLRELHDFCEITGRWPE